MPSSSSKYQRMPDDEEQMPPADLSASDSSLREQIYGSFPDLALSLGASQEAAHRWAERIVAGYTEPQRHYHTLSHIASMLSCLQEQISAVSDPVTVQLAIYFHDVIYDPTLGNNELASIELFHAFAKEVPISPECVDACTLYIERTIKHTLPETGVTGDLKLFLDFDLEVLSRPAPAYEVYSRAIRQEYSHVPEDAYRRGRSDVLNSFLQRSRLYFTSSFYNTGEERARENLGREIKALRA